MRASAVVNCQCTGVPRALRSRTQAAISAPSTASGDDGGQAADGADHQTGPLVVPQLHLAGRGRQPHPPPLPLRDAGGQAALDGVRARYRTMGGEPTRLVGADTVIPIQYV